MIMTLCIPVKVLVPHQNILGQRVYPFKYSIISVDTKKISNKFNGRKKLSYKSPKKG